MTKFFLLITGFAFNFALVAQNRSINFDHSTFSELKEKAAKEKKLVFIDAFTTWCGPCIYMAASIFTNDTVADYYNAGFINAKIDMEKGEGLEIAKQYDVKCYPTFLFVNGDGKLVHRISGSMNAREFIAAAEDARHPQNNFSAVKANYEAHKNDGAALLRYLKTMRSTCLDPGDAVSTYFAGQKDAALTSKANWEMIRDYTNSLDSREFKYLTANKAAFDKLYTAKVVDAKIDDVARTETWNAVKTGDDAKLKETEAKIESLHLPNGKEILLEADLSMAKQKKDWDAYSRLAVENVDTYYLENSGKLNRIAWTIYENVTDKAALAKAEEWAQKAVKLKMSYATLDTYAAILYKNGKKDLAEENANKAIRYARSDKADYTATSELLEKIKAMK
ncbi:MAG: thioredoxin domain-containing protein [Bacteroidia bacterium]